MTKHTSGPWNVFNMVNEDGSVMKAEQIGDYVKANVVKSIENGGSAERFLFVAREGEGEPDICHVGNGPNGPNNALLIAAAPDLLSALEKMVDKATKQNWNDMYPDQLEEAMAAIDKARGV